MRTNTCVAFVPTWKTQDLKVWSPIEGHSSWGRHESANKIVMAIADELLCSSTHLVDKDGKTLYNGEKSRQRTFEIDVSTRKNYKSLVEAFTYSFGCRRFVTSLEADYAPEVEIEVTEQKTSKEYVLKLNRGNLCWHILPK